MDETLKADRQYADYDMYAALMLSNLLDNEQDVKDQKVQVERQQTIQEEDEEEEQEDIIWVPADKHPQIAPTEFANFIKTHGTKSPIKSGRLNRRKSILSQSLSVKNTQQHRREEEDNDDDEEADLNRTLSEKKRNFLKKVMTDNVNLKEAANIFDRNSPGIDESLIIAPKSDKSLLRRSAFSARGRSRKTEDRQQMKRRSVSQRKPSSENIKNESWDKKSGIDLFDQPVNMSEWIDLGSVSLDSDDSQRGIISRVHDAESQLRSTAATTQDHPTVKDVVEPKQVLASVKEEQKGPKRPSMVRAPTETITTTTTADGAGGGVLVVATTTKPEKRSSWLSGLFQPNNNSTNKKPMNNNNNNNNNTSSLSSLATLFSRSLSMKSNLSNLSTNHNTKSSTIHITNKNNTLIPPSPPPPQQQENKKPSRLEERSFFNSNRLPLHVERAIYRLSHMKLADPRRPLQQQVLISNLMFWYLSIQQNDFQQQEKEPVTTKQPNNNTQQQQQQQTSKKIGNKMSRLIYSAKKRKNDSKKSSNVQFSLTPIPSHHQQQFGEEEEEDDVPLSHYQS
ncbi:hypothetical protein EDC94DRAFT_272569 [Helicostylum pulchrum]|nr:hypothetical protein EDC94DRAFT_272569 [Helicostylum pulchrum]